MFCDADDFVSPQLLSVITRAVEVFRKPDMLIYNVFKAKTLPESGWPVYDVQSMKKTDAEFFDAEGVCMKIFDEQTCGYTPNKVMKRDIALSVRFDETLSCNEDEHYFVSMLLLNRNVRAYHLKHYLYCYVQHEGFGITRGSSKPLEGGFPKNMQASERMLALENLPECVKEQIEGRLYCWAVYKLFDNQDSFSDEVYRKLKEYTVNYMRKYYFVYAAHSKWRKTKVFIKHILLLLHIHK